MRIVMDLDGTLVGYFPTPRGEVHRLNRKLFSVAVNLKRQGHQLVLWTFGNRVWWRKVRSKWPELGRLFQEVYTLDDGLAHITRARYQAYGVSIPGEEPVKDIRVIGGDMLIDNNPSHKRWAERHGMGKQYILVKTFGEEAA